MSGKRLKVYASRQPSTDELNLSTFDGERLTPTLNRAEAFRLACDIIELFQFPAAPAAAPAPAQAEGWQAIGVQDIAAIAWTCIKECKDHQPPPVMCVKHQLEAEELFAATPESKKLELPAISDGVQVGQVAGNRKDHL